MYFIFFAPFIFAPVSALTVESEQRARYRHWQKKNLRKNYRPLGDDRVVGDASGKALPAALMVSNVQSSVRTALLFASDNLPVIARSLS
jgi:hypothetical protein